MSKAVKIGESQLLTDILEKETGKRKPTGIAHGAILIAAIAWSLFQLWYTSPIPYHLADYSSFIAEYGVINDRVARAAHLAFALFLAFLAFPMFSKSPSDRVPVYDWLFALAAVCCTLYLVVFQGDLNLRAGRPTQADIVISCIGMLVLLEGTRRVMGLPMTVVAAVFIVYAFAGPYMPELISHRGASMSRAASQFWISSEGVFGVPLGVSVSFVFVYVLFGAMLENAGAGNYLTSLSFALLGHLRGGPAKAAVAASGLHGLISGSSIANVLTCGPVTIMLMKKVGFSAEKAGAVEVAAGSNGQIMPPVMGAAAFLMVEYIGMPYSQLIKHAFLPAVLAYGSLMYIVHLEACKMEMEGLPRTTPLRLQLLGWGLAISALVAVMGVIYFLSAWAPVVFGSASWLFFALLLIIGYAALLLLSTRYPELKDDADEDLIHLPAVTPILFSGLYFLLPIAALVWCLMMLEMSPGLAAFYACSLLGIILISQPAVIARMRGHEVKPHLRLGFSRLIVSLIAGAKNMVGIGLATASAGIVVGSVSLTGIGQALAAVVEVLSMGSLPLILIMTAVLSLILGMGLPTTANYIIVSTLISPIIYSMTSAQGLMVPLVAIHLFCLYFGVMADATPPVALAAFAASGISGGDPFQTGVQGFIYEMRTAILPFVFLFNPEILLIGIQGPIHFAWVLVTAVIACMAFASATQRFVFTHTRWWEVLLLILTMVFLFRPGLMLNYVFPPFESLPASKVIETLDALKPGDIMRVQVETETAGGKKMRYLTMPVGEGKASDRLFAAGLLVEESGDKPEVLDVRVDSHAEKIGLDIADTHEIVGIDVPLAQPAKEWFSIPGFIALAIVLFTQRKRKRREDRFKRAQSAVFV